MSINTNKVQKSSIENYPPATRSTFSCSDTSVSVVTPKKRPTNDDLIRAINDLPLAQETMLNQNKSLGDKLKYRLDNLSAQYTSLKAEVASKLCSLDARVRAVKLGEMPTVASVTVPVVMNEIFERKECKAYSITHGPPESSSFSLVDRIARDKYCCIKKKYK